MNPRRKVRARNGLKKAHLLVEPVLGMNTNNPGMILIHLA